MSSLDTGLLDSDRRGWTTDALITTLRFSLRVINYAFALLGLAVLGYAAYLLWEVKHNQGISGYPWFIFTFGAVGLIVFITASTALVGIAHNSRFFLGVYGFLVTAILVAQAVLAILIFTDNSWKKHIPDDPTGEQEKVAKFLKQNLLVVRWVGLAILIIEVLSILIAYSLSSAQQRLVRQYSEDEDEIWTRQPAPSRARTGNAGPSRPSPGAAQRQDPWSERMRQKYGLDTSVFTYDPARTDQQLAQEQLIEQKQAQRRCSIM